MPYTHTADLPEINEPFEMMELLDGQSITLDIGKWELGKTTIQPRDGRPAREVPVLRAHVPETQKPTLPHYWDITSKHLVTGLLGFLERDPPGRWRFTVTKRGSGPAARFTLQADPLGA